jgi:hypothetical protein
MLGKRLAWSLSINLKIFLEVKDYAGAYAPRGLWHIRVLSAWHLAASKNHAARRVNACLGSFALAQSVATWAGVGGGHCCFVPQRLAQFAAPAKALG